VAAAIHSFGRLDVVVNNAAAASMMPIEDVSDDDFRSQVEIVFYGTVNVTKAAIPFFRKQGYGHFIQISSISARRTIPGLGAYESAKWAQEGFSHVLALELAPFNIKVTIAEPAGLRTGMAMAHGPRSFSDDYDVTVGNEARRFLKRLGCEPIDPHKVACVLMDVAQMEDPPLRLVLGADAVDVVVHLNAKQAEEDSKWAAIGRSVDFSRDEPQASEICHAH
jgi:NAD(P)-dependent dehydrogenase (short-subunit alcohol dehydrogenase family)